MRFCETANIRKLDYAKSPKRDPVKSLENSGAREVPRE